MHEETARPRAGFAATVRAAGPGFLLCATIGLAAAFVSDHYGGPTLLYALLLGMAFNFLAHDERTRDGVEISARHVLRVGVALLGARITLPEIVALGWQPIIVVLVSVTSTIGFGYLFSRWLGLSRNFGLLSGGATAICGASAAMALSVALPAHRHRERDTLFTIIAVTTLSTIAMILYPLIADATGMDDTVAGIFLGATIHDVAQVVGAGFMMSDATGHVATVTKLIRVALLIPSVVIIGYIAARGEQAPQAGTSLRRVPLFLVAFILVVLANSAGLLPPQAKDVLSEASRLCLVVAIAALGVRTSFLELAKVGWRPALLMVGETVFLAAIVAAIVLW